MTARLQTQLGFAGLRVVAFESRFAEEIAQLIPRHGGILQVAPSMAEVPLEENVRPLSLRRSYCEGKYKWWLESHYSRRSLVEALAKATVIARGPNDGMIRSGSDVDRLQEVEPQESLQFVFDAIRKTRAGLRSDILLVGFAGLPSPWPLTSLREAPPRTIAIPKP